MNASTDHARHPHARTRTFRRREIGVDTTPLVDLALLLLAFFMATTALTRPQALEIVLPDMLVQHVEMPKRRDVTLYEYGGAMFIKRGERGAMERLADGGLGVALAAERTRAQQDVAWHVEAARDARYGDVVRLIDAVHTLASVRGTTEPFTIESMSANELKEADAL